MDTTKLVSLIELLDDNLDDLEDALEPLCQQSLVDTAGKLPVLDKAQLYVLVTYAIESILFSYLRLNGVNAKEHPIYVELTRVKQYFEKIKAAEMAGSGTKPTTQLDKAAAGRFIKHALAGNEKADTMAAKRTEEQSTIGLQASSTKRKLDTDSESNGVNAAQHQKQHIRFEDGAVDMAKKSSAISESVQSSRSSHNELSKEERSRRKMAKKQAKRERQSLQANQT